MTMRMLVLGLALCAPFPAHAQWVEAEEDAEEEVVEEADPGWSARAAYGGWYQWWSVVNDPPTAEDADLGSVTTIEETITLEPGLGQTFSLGGHIGPVRLATRWMRSNASDAQVQDLNRARQLAAFAGLRTGDRGELQVHVSTVTLPGSISHSSYRGTFVHSHRTVELRWMASPAYGDGGWLGWFAGLRSDRTETMQAVHVAETGVVQQAFIGDATLSRVTPEFGFSFIDRLAYEERSYFGPYGDVAFGFPSFGSATFTRPDGETFSEDVVIGVLMAFDLGVVGYLHSPKRGGGPYIQLGGRVEFASNMSTVTEEEDGTPMEGQALLFTRTDMRAGPYVDVGVAF